MGCEGLTAYQIPTNSECRDAMPGSEPRGAKVPRREGKNPDQRLRARSVR